MYDGRILDRIFFEYLSVWSKPFSQMTPGDMFFLVGAPVTTVIAVVTALLALVRLFEIAGAPGEWASEKMERWRNRDEFTKWVLRACGVLLLLWILLMAWIAINK